MKLSEMIDAFPALQELSTLQLPYSKARQLAKVQKRAQEEFGFFSTEEQKLVDQYAGKDENGHPKVEGGKITFETQEKMKSYLEAIKELKNLEIEWELQSVPLTSEDFGSQTLSAKSIGSLEGFVDWREA